METLIWTAEFEWKLLGEQKRSKDVRHRGLIGLQMQMSGSYSQVHTANGFITLLAARANARSSICFGVLWESAWQAWRR